MGLVCFLIHMVPFMTISPLLSYITLKHRFLNYTVITIRAHEMPTSVNNDMRREKQIMVFFLWLIIGVSMCQ